MANDEVKVIYRAEDKVSDVVNRITNNMTNGANKWQTINKKVKSGFVNLNGDVNRASSGMSGFSKMLSKTASIGATIGALHVASNALQGFVESAMQSIETTNLFNVALGDMSGRAEETVQRLSNLYGLDPTNLRSSIGTYAMLARSMGMTSQQASTLGTSTTQLALDLSSLFNVSFTQAMQDLRSGLVGQSETVYKYGIDVTEAGIKAEALAQGITKSVRSMSQGEKMALRYGTMLRQTALAQGDFARTINAPANQLRILKERFVTLSRSIGNIFIPILSAILPYINALVMWLITLANAIAKFFGYTPSETAGTGSVGGGAFEEVADEAGGAGGAIDNATKSAKKFKQALLGIDEINTLAMPEDDADAGAGGGGGGGGLGAGMGIGDFNIEPYDILDGMKSKADEIFADIQANINNLVKIAQPAIEAFQRLWSVLGITVAPFMFGILEDFYNSFLVPVAQWTLGEGLPRFFDILTGIALKINWKALRDSLDGLFSSLANFTTISADGILWLLDKFLKPLAVWVGNDLLPQFIDTLSSAFDAFSRVIEIAKPLIQDLLDNVLTPLGNWAGESIIDGLKKMQDRFDTFVDSTEDIESSADTINTSLGNLFDTLVIVGTALAVITGIAGIGGMVTGMLNLAVALEGLGKLPLIGGIFTTVADLALKFALAFEHVGAVIGAVGAVPMAIIIAVIALIVGALVSVWRTSEEFRDKWKEVWNNIKGVLQAVWDSFLKPIFKGLKDMVLGIWNEGLKPLWVQWKEVWKQIGLIVASVFNAILPILKELIRYIGPMIANVLTTFFNNFKTAFVLVATVVGDLFRSVSTIFSGIKNIFNGLVTFLTGVFTGNWKKAWDGVKQIFKGVFESLWGIAKFPLNLIITGINQMINGLNKFKITIPPWLQKLTGINAGSFGFNIPTIPKLARGGLLDAGTLFEAGEAGKAEMIGSHNGKTAVMPLENTDFVSAMRDAVYSAMTSAMGSSGDGNVIIEIGGTEFGRVAVNSINKLTKQEGRNLLNI